MAEALTNAPPDGIVRAYSAGFVPRSRCLPLVSATLQSHGVPADGLRSKAVWEFDRPGAPRFDFVIMTGDDSAACIRPTLPGRPIYADWHIPDPDIGSDDPKQIRRRVEASFQLIRRCVHLFVSLPPEMRDRLAIEESMGLDLDESTIALLSEALRSGVPN